MALVIFRSRAAGEIYYFPEDAHRLLEIAGKAPDERGIFTTDQLAEAIARIETAVAEEGAAKPVEQDQDDDQAGTPGRKRIALAQRAFPLLEMLHAAQKKRVDVTWGV